MVSEVHHVELIKGISEQMKPILAKSPQAIYIYLDDNHKVCNKRFAELLGYKSPKEWSEVEAPLADVVEEDQQGVIDAYMNASKRMVASSVEVRLKNIQTGTIVKTRMIVAPFGHAGHVFTVHFFDIM